jgi:hypothetical protein
MSYSAADLLPIMVMAAMAIRTGRAGGKEMKQE